MKKRGGRRGRARVTLVHFVRYVTQPWADISSKTATGSFRLTLKWVLKIMGTFAPAGQLSSAKAQSAEGGTF